MRPSLRCPIFVATSLLRREIAIIIIILLLYVIECVSPQEVQSSDCVRNIYRFYFGLSVLYDPKLDETLPHRRYPRLVSMLPDPFSSALVNDRLLIDWNVPATLVSFQEDLFTIFCYFAPLTRHSYTAMCTTFFRKDFFRLFDGRLRISTRKPNVEPRCLTSLDGHDGAICAADTSIKQMWTLK